MLLYEHVGAQVAMFVKQCFINRFEIIVNGDTTVRPIVACVPLVTHR